MGLAVKVVDGFDEADAADLKEVVDVLAAGGEALDHAEHQPQVPGDELFPGGFVALMGAPEQRAGGLRVQSAQPRGVHAADLYFTLQNKTSLAGLVCPQGRSVYTWQIIPRR